MVAQVVRFWPEYEKIKEMHDAGAFGEIKMVYANRLAQHPNWMHWHANPNNSGGGLFDLHLQDIDFACHMFGEMDSVYATGWKSKTGYWDHVATTLEFKNGVRAVVEGAFDMTDNYPFITTFRIVGESETAEYEIKAGLNLEDISSATRKLMLYQTECQPVIVQVSAEGDAYQKELEYFASCIATGGKNTKVNITDSRNVLKVVLAIKESLEKQRRIEIEL